jgi:hypothetical protein
MDPDTSRHIISMGTAVKKKKSGGAKYFGKPFTGDPDDAPELLTDFFRHGEKLIRRGRPPLSGKPKTAITLRLDEDTSRRIARLARVGRRASMQTRGARGNSEPQRRRAAGLRRSSGASNERNHRVRGRRS